MKGQYFPVYWSPDIAPDWSVNPGVLTTVSNLYPTKRNTLKAYNCSGGVGNWTGDPVMDPVVVGTPLAGRVLRDPSGTAKTIVGTTKRLYKNNVNLWTDISLGGADYTTASDWHFAAWGTSWFAVSKANNPQVSVSGATFADLGGTPPKAKLVCVQKDFVLLADCNDGTDLGDQVCWSGIGNSTSWTTGANNLATQAGNARLRDTPGAIAALEPLGADVIAYKADSIYRGVYTGRSPYFWEWQCISYNVGCGSPHGVATVGDAHYFQHATGIYRLSGGGLELLNNNASRYLRTNSYDFTSMHSGWDEHEKLIVWFLRTSSTTTAAFSAGLGYNAITKQLGLVTPHAAYNATGVIRGSYADFSASGMTAPTTSQLAIMVTGATTFGGNNLGWVQYADILGTTCSLTTGHLGSDTEYSQDIRITPRCYALTSLSSATDNNRDRIYDASPTATTASEDNERIDVLAANRWHQLTFTASAMEIAGLTVEGLKVSDD